ncbi:protein of unknown function [Prosthecobacter debontii]|uniref:DNA mimic protein DMP19 C-terminal domain-containing protein n=1 Tax=Prosthecobacter debontii TaxID=48467 RepID=A0A1T4YMT0_9BACT|nr:DUF4375 domain-containing protein [Prosthecobacter debontii]SKB03109.1 protein of unknown function [Prosthecobacter debontii]
MIPILSIQGLDLEDPYFIFKLADRIAESVNVDDTPESAERLQALPQPWRYIAPLVAYYNEVNNGGHHQYFWNTQGVYRDLVAEGLKYYRAEAFERNYDEALRLYRPDLYDIAQGASYEAYDQASRADRFDQQDRCFYATRPKLTEVLSKEVREGKDGYQ